MVNLDYRSEKMIENKFIVNSDTGFARPATFLVDIARRFQSDIFLVYKREPINLKTSLMDVMLLDIRPGSTFNVRAKGVDKVKALKAIENQLATFNIVKELACNSCCCSA
jgi:phosphotransferase system HPr (HPr) family protein